MSTPTEFDKALDDILLRHGAEQGELHHSLKEAIKQAFDTYLIRDDVDNNQSLSMRRFYTIEGGNIVRKMQRQVLWSTNK